MHVQIGKGRGRDNQYGLNIGQRQEMAAALQAWWLTSRETQLVMSIPGGGRIITNTELQAIKLFWHLADGQFLPNAAHGQTAKISANSIYRMREQ